MTKKLLSIGLFAAVSFAAVCLTAGTAVSPAVVVPAAADNSGIKSKEICVGSKQNGALDNYGGRTESNIGPLAGYYGAYFSQSVYTPADLELGEEGIVNLTKITYAAEKGYEAKTMPVEVYVGETEVDEVYTSSPVQLEGQTKVYDGNWVFNMGANVIEVPFSAPLPYDTSKNLVVTVIKKNTSSTYVINWKWFDTPSGKTQYVQGGSVDKSYLSGDERFKSLPVMTLFYAPAGAGEVKVVDLAAPAIKVPATIEEGTAAEIKVDVVNRGTEAVSGYTVEVLDVTDEAAPVTLASTVVEAVLEPQAQKTVSLSVTLNNRGVYKLAGRVVLEGDNTPDNDRSAAVAAEVSMKKPEGIRAQALNVWETWEETYGGVTNVVGSNTSNFIPGSGIYRMAAAQYIYPASMVDMVRSGQIYSMSFFLKKYEYTSPEPMHCKVYLGTTDKTEFVDSYAMSGQTLVYEGDKMFYPCAEGTEWKINFQTPFAYDNTKSLVVTVVSETANVPSIMPFVHCNKGSVTSEISYQSGSRFDLFSRRGYAGVTLPVASIEYLLDPVRQYVDVAVSPLTESTPFNQDTRKAVYAVTVQNLGTMDVEGFTVEIVNMVEGAEPVVLASRTYDRILAAESEFNAKVPVTFTEEGRFDLAARVVVANDENPANNISPEYLLLNVGENTGLNSVLAAKFKVADGVLKLNGAASRVCVFDAAGRLLVNADAAGLDALPLNLNAGIYTVVVRCADGRNATLKVVK